MKRLLWILLLLLCPKLVHAAESVIGGGGGGSGGLTNGYGFAAGQFSLIGSNVYIKTGALLTNLNAIGSANFNYVTGSRVAGFDASGNLTNIATTVTEGNYVSGVTGPIQAQLDLKQPASANLTNWSLLSTGSVVYPSQLGTAAYSNATVFASSGNLTTVSNSVNGVITALNVVSNGLDTTSNSLVVLTSGLLSLSNNVTTISNMVVTATGNITVVSNGLNTTSNSLVTTIANLNTVSNGLNTTSNSLAGLTTYAIAVSNRVEDGTAYTTGVSNLVVNGVAYTTGVSNNVVAVQTFSDGVSNRVINAVTYATGISNNVVAATNAIVNRVNNALMPQSLYFTNSTTIFPGTNADGSLYFNAGGTVLLTNALGLNAVQTTNIGGGVVVATNLANTSVTPGSYTFSSITVDAQGRLTSASGASGQLPVANIATNETAITHGISLDGGNATITAGAKGFFVVPYDCTIYGWYLTAQPAGTIQLDIWLTNGPNPTVTVPTSTYTITASAKPTLTAAAGAAQMGVPTWLVTNITAGACIRYNVDNATTCSNATLNLVLRKR
jgi:hypothetical protein